MSDPVSALAGATSSGFIEVVEAGPVGMVTIRGDLSEEPIRNAIAGGLVSSLPEPRMSVAAGADRLIWMSPDELLLVCPHDEAEPRVATLSQALAGTHHMVVNVSDARAVFDLSGEAATLRDALAKLTPADLRKQHLPLGEVRRTRLAQVPAALWFETDTQARVVCFRSVATYVFGLLSQSAKTGGEVGHHR